MISLAHTMTLANFSRDIKTEHLQTQFSKIKNTREHQLQRPTLWEKWHKSIEFTQEGLPEMIKNDNIIACWPYYVKHWVYFSL